MDITLGIHLIQTLQVYIEEGMDFA